MRVSSPYIIFPLLIMLQGVVFAAVQYIASGTVAFPLDDTYIHLQYAKQIALGNYFQYQAGMPASSGATSFLYVHVLALGYWIGFRGDWFFLWVFFTAFASYTALGYFLLKLGNTLRCEMVSYSALALILVSGWLGWSFWSGMEVVLFSALLTGTAWKLFTQQDRDAAVWLLAGLTSLCRPEGALFLGLILLMKFAFDLAAGKNLASIVSGIPLIGYIFIMAGVLLPPLVTYLTTGTFSSNGLLAKWVFYHPLMTLQEQISQIGTNVGEMLLFLSGVSSLMNSLWDFVLPGTLPAALIGFGLLVSRPESRKPACMLFIPLLLSVFFIATLEVWHLHGFRYIAPFIPLLYFFGLLGIQKLIHAGLRSPQTAFTGFIAVLLIGSFTFFPLWLMRYAEHGTMIAHKQKQTAEWINRNLPKDTRIAINDAGALAYYGNYPIYDMVGLVTNGNALAYRMGDAGTYENLTALPEENRPQFAVVFQSWFDEMAKTYDIFRQPLVAFPEPFDTGYSKRVYRVNWNYAGKEEKPRPYNVPQGWELRDELDVVHLASEKAHHYELDVKGSEFPKVPVGLRRNFGYQNEIQALWPQVKDARPFLIPMLKKQGLIYDYDIVDSGRRIDGEERFVLHHLIPGKDVHLVMRTSEDLGKYPDYHYRLALYVNGRFLEEINVQGTPWNWIEVQMSIPGDLITDETADIRIRNLGTERFDYYMSFYYWVYQPRPETNSLDNRISAK